MNQGLKTLLELGPILIFVALTYTMGIQPAILVFIVLSAISMGIHWYLAGHVTPMQWIGTALILVFGIPSLILDDPRIFKIKPTIASGLFAIILGAAYVMKKPFIKNLFGSAFDMPDSVWLKLTLRWALFFVAMAVANEILWRSLSDEGWAMAKIGYFVASLVFGVAQAPLLMPYIKDDDKPA